MGKKQKNFMPQALWAFTLKLYGSVVCGFLSKLGLFVTVNEKYTSLLQNLSISITLRVLNFQQMAKLCFTANVSHLHWQ